MLVVRNRPGMLVNLLIVECEQIKYTKDMNDYYFPETKDIERSQLYYDFDSILEPITARTASNVDVIKPPEGKLYGKKYLITGDYNKSNFSRAIRRHARYYDVHGHIKLIDANTKEIIVVWTDINE